MKHLLIFLWNFFLILLFIGFTALVIFSPFLLGVSLEGYKNDYCQSSEAAIIANDPSNPLNLVCDNKYKKEKFIWLFLDGLAYDQLAKIPIDKETLNITNFFRIKAKDYKQSASLHESMITGKFSRNYPAQTTKIDHIFRQIKYSDEKKLIHYFGTAFPLFYLLGKNESDVLTSHKIAHFEAFPLDSLCPNDFNLIRPEIVDELIEKYTNQSSPYLKPEMTKSDLYHELLNHYKETNERISSKLDGCMENIIDPAKPESLIFYTMRMDHMNHALNKRNIKTLFNAFTFETGIIALTQWINAHPEYALIVSSDHGGQNYKGEDDICNHGCDSEGNEAIFMIYTKELGYNYQQLHQNNKFIWIDNEAPTVAQIIKNVNIPLEAQGLAYELGNDNILKYAAIKSKEIQLKQFIKKVMMKYPHKEPLMIKFMKRIQGSEYAQKIVEMDDVLKMDDEFYKKYQQYLIGIQKKINDEIRKESNPLVYSIIYYIIIVGLLTKVVSEIKHIQSLTIIEKDEKLNIPNGIKAITVETEIGIEIKTKTHCKYHYSALLGMILFALSIELILCFIFSKHKLSDIIIIARQIECFLLFISSLYYLWLYGFDSKLFYAMLFLLFGTVTVVMINYDLFITIRRFLSKFPLSIYINICLNYPVGLMYLLYEVYCIKDYYLDSKLKLKLGYVMYPLCAIIIIIMGIFDYGIPENFVRHSIGRMINIRIIYGLLGVMCVFSFKQLWMDRPSDANMKDAIQRKKVKSMVLFKFFMFFYVFFISDETERLLIILMFIPFNLLLINNLYNEKNMHWKLISFCFLLMIPDILYIITRNTFSFDISMKVTNKCLGPLLDDTPIITGILMGTHKLKFFMLTAGYLISVSKVSKKNFIKNDTYMIILTLDVQMVMMICLYCFCLWRGYEENYLQIFLWVMTKCMIIILLDIIILIWFIITHCIKKCLFGNDSSQSNNNKFAKVISTEVQQA